MYSFIYFILELLVVHTRGCLWNYIFFVLCIHTHLCFSSTTSGLLLPHVGVQKYGVERTDAGNLGSGIYFSDTFRFVGSVKITLTPDGLDSPKRPEKALRPSRTKPPSPPPAEPAWSTQCATPATARGCWWCATWRWGSAKTCARETLRWPGPRTGTTASTGSAARRAPNPTSRWAARKRVCKWNGKENMRR